MLLFVCYDNNINSPPRMAACYAVAFLLFAYLFAWAAATPLDDYVHKPDPSYEFRDLKIPVKMDGYTVHFLNMTSQTWLSCKCVMIHHYWVCSKNKVN